MTRTTFSLGEGHPLLSFPQLLTAPFLFLYFPDNGNRWENRSRPAVPLALCFGHNSGERPQGTPSLLLPPSTAQHFHLRAFSAPQIE